LLLQIILLQSFILKLSWFICRIIRSLYLEIVFTWLSSKFLFNRFISTHKTLNSFLNELIPLILIFIYNL